MAGVIEQSPAEVLAQLMIDSGIVGDPEADPAEDWPVSVNAEADEPDDVVTAFDVSGLTLARIQTDGLNAENYGVQLRFRSAHPRDGFAKASAVAASLSGDVYDREVLVDDTLYRVQSVSTGGVIRAGVDPNSARTIHTLNCTLFLTKL